MDSARFLCALLVLAVASTSCTSTMRPPRSPRVATYIDNGALFIVRDDAYYREAMGVGLVAAVRGNPEALRSAQTYLGLRVTGTVLSVLGGVAVGVSPIPYALHQDMAQVSDGLFWGGLGVVALSLLFHYLAEPHFHDAINIFNAGLELDCSRRAATAAPAEVTPDAVAEPAGEPPAPSVSSGTWGPTPTPPSPSPSPAAAPSPTGTCEVNSDCAEGQYCRHDGVCTTDCRTDRDCAAEQTCDVRNGRCQ